MAAPYLANYGRAVQQGPANFSGNGEQEEEYRRTSASAQPMMAGAAIPPQAIPPPGMPKTPTGLQAAPMPSTAGMSKAPLVAPPGGVQQGQQQGLTLGGGSGPGGLPGNLSEAAAALPGGGGTQRQENDTPSGTTYGNQGSTTTGGQGGTVTTPGGGQTNPGGWLRDKIGEVETPDGNNIRDATRDAPQPPGPAEWQSEMDSLRAELEAMKNRGMSSAQDLANQIQNTTSQTFNPTINMPDPTAGLRDMFGGAMSNLGNFNIGMFLNALGLGGLMGGGGGGGGFSGVPGFPGMGGGGGSSGAQGGGFGQGGFGQSNTQTATSQWGNRQTTGQGAQYGGQGSAAQNNVGGRRQAPSFAGQSSGFSSATGQGSAAQNYVGGRRQALSFAEQSSGFSSATGQGSAAQNNVGGRRQAPSFAGQSSGFSSATGQAADQQGGGLSRGGPGIPPPGGMTRQNPTFGGPGMEPVQGLPTAQGAMQASMPARAPAGGGLSGGGALMGGVPQPQMAAQQGGGPGMMAYSGGGPGIPAQAMAGLNRAAAPGGAVPQLGIPPPGGGSGGGAGGPAGGGGGGSVTQDPNGEYRVNRGGQGGTGTGAGATQPGSGNLAPGDSGGGARGNQNNSVSPGSGWGPNGTTEVEQRRQSAANRQDASNGMSNPLSAMSNLMTEEDMGRYMNYFDPFNTYNRDANNALRDQVSDYGDNNIRMGQRAEEAARQQLIGQTTNERNAQQRMLDARAARGGMSTGGAQQAINQGAQNALQAGERQLAMDSYNREMGRLGALGQARGALANSLTGGNQMDYENLLSQFTSNKETLNNFMGFLSSLGEIVPF